MTLSILSILESALQLLNNDMTSQIIFITNFVRIIHT